MVDSRSVPGRVPSLDHVGLFAHDMVTIAARYERLGFRLTPLSQHAGFDPATRQLVKGGSANRCAMLQRGYIELLAIVDPQLNPRGVAAGLQRYAGMHILAFRTDANEAVIADLCRQGFEAAAVELRRIIDTPQGAQTARFSQVRTPPGQMPEATVFMLRHDTPELLWQPGQLQHPNGAVALQEAVIVVEALDAVAARYARFFGCDDVSGQGCVRFELSAGALSLMTPAAFAQRFPAVTPPLLPWPAALVVEVADLARTGAVLRAGRVPFVERDAALQVSPPDAGGAVLEFRQCPNPSSEPTP